MTPHNTIRWYGTAPWQGGVILGEGKSQKKILMYLKIDFAEATKSAILGQCKEPIRLVDLLNIPIRMARKVGITIMNCTMMKRAVRCGAVQCGTKERTERSRAEQNT